MALWLHYIVLVALLVAVSAKYISPLLFWIPAFFGLAFPVLFLLNLVFVIYWFAQFKSQVLFGIVMLALSIPTAYRYVQFSFGNESSDNKALKVTSYNCMLFDLYNWYRPWETRPHIFNSLVDINPDILCLQEFYTSEQKGDYNNIDTVRLRLKMNYHHCEYTTTLRSFDHWGVATFSKYPIINQGKIVFQTTSNNICIYSDIVLNKDTVRVYNIHLQSIGFNKKDNKFLEDVMAEKPVEGQVDKSRHILSRLKMAFMKRARQVEMIVAHMKTSPYRIILCGDFNDTAASYAYQQLTRNLEDAFLEKGFGIGRTYAGKWPQFRIDYILHDKKLKCSRYIKTDPTYTDHHPITACFDNINWEQ